MQFLKDVNDLYELYNDCYILKDDKKHNTKMYELFTRSYDYLDKCSKNKKIDSENKNK